MNEDLARERAASPINVEVSLPKHHEGHTGTTARLCQSHAIVIHISNHTPELVIYVLIRIMCNSHRTRWCMMCYSNTKGASSPLRNPIMSLILPSSHFCELAWFSHGSNIPTRTLFRCLRKISLSSSVLSVRRSQTRFVQTHGGPEAMRYTVGDVSRGVEGM